MEMPNALQLALYSQTSSIPNEQLLTAAQDISLRYRNRSNLAGKHFIQNSNEAMAYAIARMPATFGAVYSALNHTMNSPDTKALNISSLMDIGAGTGAATWAANEFFHLNSITCIEYDTHMKRLGKAFMSDATEPLKSANWEQLNIANDPIPWQADLVVAAYVINEIEESIQLDIAKKLWSATKKVLLFVDAGTPAGYHVLNRIRTELLGHNAHILAPCPHENTCPITESDWCHFTCRIQRSRLHRLAKGGEAPYEDEKYSYLALTKESVSSDFGRILRHPQIEKGHIKLNLCTKEGLKQITYSKKNGDLYKLAKKADCGDKIMYD